MDVGWHLKHLFFFLDQNLTNVLKGLQDIHHINYWLKIRVYLVNDHRYDLASTRIKLM